MENPMVAATLQSAFLGGVCNILAQLITAYREEADDMWIDWIPVFKFVLFAVIVTPPNFLWQQFLESSFPAHPAPEQHPKKSDEPPPAPKLSIRNTIIKLILDQTVGSAVNTILFGVYAHSMRIATAHAPRITNVHKAISWWCSPGALDFTKVDLNEVWAAAKADTLPMMFAAWKLWPAVSLLNFTLVKTVQMRNLVGNLAGLGWGVYVSLVTA